MTTTRCNIPDGLHVQQHHRTSHLVERTVTRRDATKTYGAANVKLHTFLTSAAVIRRDATKTYGAANVKLHTLTSAAVIRRDATKTYEAANVKLHTFLTSAADGGEQSASSLGRFTREAKSLHLLGTKLRSVDRPGHRTVTILSYPGSTQNIRHGVSLISILISRKLTF